MIDEFREARQLVSSNPEAVQRSHQAILACDKAIVLAYFDDQLQDPDFEKRAQAVEELTFLYRTDAVDTIVRGLDDESSVVRWVVCGCLHDFGDGRAQAGLLERLNHDPDPQVRGTAASALGSIGNPAVLPDLHVVSQTDHEVDPMGYTPCSQAKEAISDLLRRWVIQQINGESSMQFREVFAKGELTGRVVAESIPFDDQGRLRHTERYAQLPSSLLGFGWSSMIELQTNLIAPFEIEIVYSGSQCLIRRIYVFWQDAESTNPNWCVHTVLDTAVVAPGEVYRPPSS